MLRFGLLETEALNNVIRTSLSWLRTKILSEAVTMG